MKKNLLLFLAALTLFSGCAEVSPELKPLKKVDSVQVTVGIDGTLDAKNTAALFGLVHDLRIAEAYYSDQVAIYIKWRKAI